MRSVPGLPIWFPMESQYPEDLRPTAAAGLFQRPGAASYLDFGRCSIRRPKNWSIAMLSIARRRQSQHQSENSCDENLHVLPSRGKLATRKALKNALSDD